MYDEFPVLTGGSGAAFLLNSPAGLSSTLSFSDGKVVLRKDAPFATVALNASLNQEDAKNQAWQMLQEALDVLAAQRRATLQTAEGDCTYLVWTKDGDGYQLVLVDTADMPWSLSATVSLGGAGSEVVEQAPAPLPRHPAMRFYRLAHASDDLFDAYRNAYLALECLASEATPKGANESELSWLRRALSGPLSPGIPPGVVQSGTIEDLYRGGRLPTFHAKVDSTFYAPHGVERQSMQGRFEKLALLVNCLLQHRFGPVFVRRTGSMSQSLYDGMASVSLSFDEIVLIDGELRAQVPVIVESVSSPKRFNQLWGRTSIMRPANLQWFGGLEARKGGAAWISSEFEERLPLQGVNTISIELNLLQYNSKSKRPVHRR